MAVEAGVAYISIAASTKDFARDVRSALGDFDKESRKTTDGKKGFGAMLAAGAVKGLKVTGKAIAATAAIVAGIAIKGGISRALAIEDAQAKLKGLGHDTKSIEKIMDNALASVKGTAFGLGDATGQAATLVAAGIKPGQDLEKTLRLVADSATIAGTDLNDMGLIWGKVAAKGRVDGSIVNQMLERQIPILDMLGDHYGVSAAKAAEMVTKGKVNFADFSQAMESMVGGAALKSGETTRGAWNNMLAALGRVGEKLVSKALPHVREFFGQVIEWADRVAPHVEAFAALVGDKIPVVAWIKDNLVPALKQIAQWINTNVMPAVSEFGTWLTETGVPAIKSFGSWLRDNLLKYLDDLVGLFRTEVLPVVQNFIGEMRSGEGQGGAFADAIKSVATRLRDAAKWLVENRTLVWSLVGAFVAWKVAAATLGLARLIISLYETAAAWVAATVAKAKDIAVTATLAAMYVGQFLAGIVRTTAAIVVSTGAMIAQRTAMVAQRTAMIAVRGAMLVATAAQWAWNAALTANPIGIVVAAIAALVAGLVWFFTQTETGQKLWEDLTDAVVAGWKWLEDAFWGGVDFVMRWMSKLWNFLKKVWEWSPLGLVVNNWDKITAYFSGWKDKVIRWFQAAKDWIIDKFLNYTPLGLLIKNWDGIIGWFQDLPGKVGNALRTIADIVLGPFKRGFNGVARAWNNSVGKLSWTVPDIPGVPGRGETFSFPKIPQLAEGGWVTRPTIAEIGEGRYPEVVAPLPRYIDMVNDAALQMRDGAESAPQVTIHANNVNESAVAREVERGLAFAGV